MRSVFSLLLFLTLLMSGASASAAEVRVFKPMEEGVSAMELRAQALAEGFAQAVWEASAPLLPAKPDDARMEVFREYLTGRAEPYVLGYKVLSTESSAAGLILRLDVAVNKPALRGCLRGLGLTAPQPSAASVALPEDLDPETAALIRRLEVLSGLRVEPSVLPRFSLERIGKANAYRARLELDDREWMSSGNDVPALWLDLWAHYFAREAAAAARTDRQRLTVTGWFSPDAVLEFDRILRGWDGSVQDVRLVEMDMLPAGVGGAWTLRLLDAKRLASRLQGFLPQRGLTYKLEERAAD